MSSVRGGNNPRGRGRGSAPTGTRGRGRGASTLRGRVFNNAGAPRGNLSSRAAFGQAARGVANTRGPGLNNARSNAAQASSAKAASSGGNTRGSWSERYQALNAARDREREDAIRQGLVADPEKPRALSEAITPVGTCQDMCAEFERVQRVVQDDVWTEENGADGQPDESRFIKKFRRSAAGLEEQLPSDLRPPLVLKKTCDYLFDEVIGTAPSLASVHLFVWDRTRAIRNDFSIQQLTKVDELRIAVECYERIARFHILSMHQLASADRAYPRYDWKQEREQLDRTLISLMQYYEDSRGRIEFPNEAEFRAYWVIFQLQSPTPDLEDIVQAWPRRILYNKRVRKALDVYAAGCTAGRPQGPVQPRASHLIARQDWQRVWVLLESNEVSYLTACTAEIYFNTIRQTVLNALFRTFRANSTIPTPEWTLNVLCEFLAFDDEEEVMRYCEYYGFAFSEREDGELYLDLTSVPGKALPQPKADIPHQLKSSLVEVKRLGRTLPAIINGLSVHQAQDTGLVVEEEGSDEGMDGVEDGEGEDGGLMEDEQPAEEDEDSLFIPEDKTLKVAPAEKAPTLMNGFGSQANASPFSLGEPSTGGTASPFSSGAPAVQPPNTTNSAPKFDFLSGASKNGTNGATEKSGFSFLGNASKPTEKTASPFDFLGAGSKSSEATANDKSTFGFSGGNGGSGFGVPSQTNKTGTETGKDGNASTKPTVPATSQSNDLFSRMSKDPATASSPFKSPTGGAPSLSNPEQKESAPVSQSPPFSTFLPQPASKPTSSELAEAPRNTPPSPFVESPKSPETAPSFPSQTKQAQPQSNAPSVNIPPSPSNTQQSLSTLNTGLRRASSSADTKPKKPSPLSHSFTAADDSSAPAREHQATCPAPSEAAAENSLKPPPQPQQNQLPSLQQVSTAAASTEHNGLKKPTPFKRHPDPAQEVTESFDNTVGRLAQELVDDEISGYLKQYIEYKVSKTITSVQEEIAAEKMKLRLSELRISTIYRKYFKRWFSTIWQKRLAKSGKDRRQRRRKRLEEGIDDGSARDNESMRSSSRPGSVMGSHVSWRDHQQNVDAMFQRTLNSTSLTRPPLSDLQAKAGSKRPTSAHGDNGSVSRSTNHKRLKSTGHVDDRGRVTKPTTTNSVKDGVKDDVLKRSSFLGFSVKGPSPPSKNTTKSNYFRLKAMGVHRADELSAPRGTKRSRTESAQPAATSPPNLRNSVSAASSPEDSTTKSLMPPPSSTKSRAQKAKEEDDALFARLRAARESLTLGTEYMRSEMETDDELRRSLSASQSSNESPSMAKARADARARASRNGSQERDVPAYRMRKSKFVPREQYGRAIERSKEMRESRSRETSRPGSRLAQSHNESLAPAPVADTTFDFDTPLENEYSTQDVAPRGSQSPAQPSTFETAATPFSPLASQAPVSFANHTTEIPDSNPFLQSTVPETVATSQANPFSPFTATQPEETQQASNGDPFSHFSALQHQETQRAFDPVAAGNTSSLASQPGFGPHFASGSNNGFGQFSFGFQSGLQSGFGSHPPAVNHSAFGAPSSFASKSAFGTNTMRSSFAPQDHTVQPEQIDDSLQNSFGTQPQRQDEDQRIPPQENSYMQSQTTSLLDEDDEEEEVGDASPPQDQQPEYVNGFHQEESQEELLDDASGGEALEPPNAYINSFQALTDQDDEHEVGSLSQGQDDEGYDQDQSDDEQEQLPDGFESQEDYSDDDNYGYGNGYYAEEERFEDGFGSNPNHGRDVGVQRERDRLMDAETDVADDEDEDEDGDGDELESNEEDFDAEEGEEEEEEALQQPWQKLEYANPYTAKPAPNPALQGAGQTEDAPIELDSD